MGESTRIPWTDHTFNIAWGCTPVSEGCQNCYAKTQAERFGFDVWGPDKPRRTFGQKHWREPLKWNAAAKAEGRRHRVFCSSMCDIFESHPTIYDELGKLWAVIRATPWLDWQLLTKRPDWMKIRLPLGWGDGWPNVWLGTTIESSRYAHRANYLRRIPAVVRFISCEPALGSLYAVDLKGIDWVIYGGESGPQFRPHQLEWARNLRRWCQASGAAFFYKQGNGLKAGTDPMLDGEVIQEWPVPRLVEVTT